MSKLLTIDARFDKLVFIILACMCSASCTAALGDATSGNTSMELPDGQLAFVSRHCGSDADVRLLTLPEMDISPLLAGQRDDRKTTWSPDGQRLGVLSFEANQQVLGIVDLSAKTERMELGGFVEQMAWTKDGASLFYLERDEQLYEYDLSIGESKRIIDGISHFSLSPNDRWLGLSMLDSQGSSGSTFRVLNLRDKEVLTVLNHKDPYCFASGRSVWSPTTDAVAVLFGATASQPSRVVVYAVHDDCLEVKADVTARDTYGQDTGEDVISSEFSDLAWSADGQSILAIRSVTDARPGGEVLRFSLDLQEYQVLPFGNSVTRLAWGTDRWLAYVVAEEGKDSLDTCTDQLRGEVWLADMDTLESQVVITDTLYTERPAWRP